VCRKSKKEGTELLQRSQAGQENNCSTKGPKRSPVVLKEEKRREKRLRLLKQTVVKRTTEVEKKSEKEKNYCSEKGPEFF
jgi:hypothetical protein